MSTTARNFVEADTYDPSEERRLHFYAKGEAIPYQPRGIWQVCKGVVQLSTLHANGDEGVIGWVPPSMCFGSWLTHLQNYHAKGLSDVYLTWFSVDEIEASPRLAQKFWDQMSRRGRQIEALLAIALQRRVEDRLQQLLLLLAQEVGQITPQGCRLDIRLTHQDIASAIGTSRVTVTRLLGKFQRQGAILFDAKRHIILGEKFREELPNGSLFKEVCPSKVF